MLKALGSIPRIAKNILKINEKGSSLLMNEDTLKPCNGIPLQRRFGRGTKE
jgi:hypothetical protein